MPALEESVAPPDPRHFHLERATVAVSASAIAALLVHVGLRGLGAAPAAAVAAAVATGLAMVLALARRLPRELDGFLVRQPVASGAWLLAALLAVGETALVSSDMLRPGPAQGGSPPEHCCLTAPVRAAGLWRAGMANPYRDDLYPDTTLAGFRLDPFYYPPPILLLAPGARALVGEDFRAARRLWYALCGLALLLAILLLVAGLEPPWRRRAIALAPALWASLPVQLGLRMSNPHALVIAASMLAFLALRDLDRLRTRMRIVSGAVGGGLLATAIAIKLFPGLICVHLVAQRRWRAVAWTVAGCGAIAVVSVLALGWSPLRAFLTYELPRLASGEACRREFASPVAIARDLSPFGLPLKLALLGVPGMTLRTSRLVSALYGLAVIALALASARRAPRSAGEDARAWLALLSLATLAGPFAPSDYASLSLVWLLCMDVELVGPWIAGGFAVATIAPYFIPRASPASIQVAAHLPLQVLALVVPATALWRSTTAHRAASVPEAPRPDA